MGKNTKAKNRVFRSISEFENAFFPKSSQKKALARPADAKALGISLARESLDRIRQQLGRQG